jgi:hypothetical protein
MKLDELLGEYRESLPRAMPVAFDEVLRRRRHQRQMQWGAIGAALALAASLVLVLWRPAAPVVPPLEQPRAMATSNEVLPAPAEHAQESPRLAPQRAPSRPRILMGGFVALASNHLLPEPELYQILRVSVSGPRLAALGVVKPQQVLSETMTADVLLGDDGLARAIRVVGAE